jgi:hypothetical protein
LALDVCHGCRGYRRIGTAPTAPSDMLKAQVSRMA